jgi:hypothetical protein
MIIIGADLSLTSSAISILKNDELILLNYTSKKPSYKWFKNSSHLINYTYHQFDNSDEYTQSEVDKLSSSKQKEAYKKFFDTGDQSTNELATGLINTLKIRIDGLFDWNELTAAYKSAVEAGQGSAESYDNAKQIIFDKLIQKVNEAYDSKDLTKTKLFKFLESVHGADVKNLFVDLNIAKHKKYSSVLDALFSKFTGHDDEILADLGNIVDLLPDRLNLLVERMSYTRLALVER